MNDAQLHSLPDRNPDDRTARSLTRLVLVNVDGTVVGVPSRQQVLAALHSRTAGRPSVTVGRRRLFLDARSVPSSVPA